MKSDYTQEHLEALIKYFKQELPDTDPYYALAQDMVQTYRKHAYMMAQIGNALHNASPYVAKFQGFWSNHH